ncbi:hypothetical protein BGY98DRAFT_959009 [Russula aff. rugulosa BPL654]|nr:hypothetical protein BGY98DRAFT_959009 [Russula aff. rugulosa BPL654]
MIRNTTGTVALLCTGWTRSKVTLKVRVPELFRDDIVQQSCCSMIVSFTTPRHCTLLQLYNNHASTGMFHSD